MAAPFNIPTEEYNNYFIWRQQDCIRNSIQMVGQANFSHKMLQNKKCEDILELLKNKGINYQADFPFYLQRGSCAYKQSMTFLATRKDKKLVILLLKKLQEKNGH